MASDCSDYRVVLREFEYQRMFAGTGSDRIYFGERYAGLLLERVFETDASKLNTLLPQFPLAQRTLYALNAFVGEVTNGGISQFLFNATPALRRAASAALEQIGDDEILSRSKALFHAAERKRGEVCAAGWDGFLEMRDAMGEKAKAFDEWFFDGQEAELDSKMRQFVQQHRDEFLVFCDGDSDLQRDWTRRILGRVLRAYEGYLKDEKRGFPKWALYHLLFTPSIRDTLGDADPVRQAEARKLAGKLVPTIRGAYRVPRRASFQSEPAPRLHLSGKGWLSSTPPLTLEYYECRSDMLWLIASR